MGTILKWIVRGILIVVGIVLLVIFVIAPVVRTANASTTKVPVTTNVGALQQQVADLTGKLNTANSEVTTLRAQISDLNAQLVAAKNVSGTSSQEVKDLQTQVTDLQGKLDQATADLATAQSVVANAFDFRLFGATKVVDLATMDFPSLLELRDGVKVPGSGWKSAEYFVSAAPKVVITRMICDDKCISVTYHPAGGNAVELLPLFQMVWVGGPNGSALPVEILNVMKSRGVSDQEQLQQNVYGVDLGAVPQDSWIEVAYEDDPALGVNKGPTISLSYDVDQMTKNLDGSMDTQISFFVQGQEDFRWTDTSATFTP